MKYRQNLKRNRIDNLCQEMEMKLTNTSSLDIDRVNNSLTRTLLDFNFVA